MKGYNDDGQTDSKLEETISSIQQASQQVDDHTYVEVPNVAWFENLVANEQRNMKKRFWSELILFWLVAVMIFSGLSVSMFFVPSLFIILQVTSVVGLTVYFKKEHSKVVQQHGKHRTS